MGIGIGAAGRWSCGRDDEHGGRQAGRYNYPAGEVLGQGSSRLRRHEHARARGGS